MKVPVNSIRAGNVIEYNGKLWVAHKVQHISPGKGGAFVAIEAKALREGNKLQERFRSGETIEHVHIDEREVPESCEQLIAMRRLENCEERGTACAQACPRKHG